MCHACSIMRGINDGARIPVSYTGKLGLSSPHLDLVHHCALRSVYLTPVPPPTRRAVARQMRSFLVLSTLIASAQAFAPQAPGATGLSHRAGLARHGVLPALTPRVLAPALARSRAVPVCSASAPQQQATLAASILGLASQPVFWWSLYTLKTTG